MSKPVPLPSAPVTIAVAAGAGLGFGFALEKGQVFAAQTIVGQFLFQDWTMMKMFLTASATSMLMHVLVSRTERGLFIVETMLCRKADRGLLLTALGSLILGSGMALAGSCPGTVLAQMGKGQPNALLIFAFGLIGAALYGLADRAQLFAPLSKVGTPKEDKLSKSFNVSYAVAGTTVSAALMAAVATMEHFFPTPLPLIPSSFTAYAWSPIAAGFIIGTLQVPMLLGVGRAVGSSSAFITLASNLLNFIAPAVVKTGKAFTDAKDGLSNFIQPVFLFAAVAGAFISATLSDTQGMPTGFTLAHLNAMLGGVLLIFGARMANGCTSGHGVSGFSLLGMRSMLATCGMFAGGIAFAHIFRALGLYPAGFMY